MVIKNQISCSESLYGLPEVECVDVEGPFPHALCGSDVR